MNQPPEDPQLPDGGDARDPDRSPLAHRDGPPVDDRPDPESILLPPLDDGSDRRRALTGRLAIAAVILALVGGAAAFALSGDDTKPAKEGVASLDGSGSGRSDGKKRSDGGQTGGGPVSDADFEDAMLAYSECMREQGIDMPDPQVSEEEMTMEDDGGIPLDMEKFEAAEEACGHHMEEAIGDVPALSPEEVAELDDQLLAMTKCMRARGYDMPDPTTDASGGITMDMPAGGPPMDDEKFMKDDEECAVEAGLMEGPGGEPGKP